MIRRLKQFLNIQNECHAELVSESQKHSNKVFNIPSFRTCFGIAMLFQRDHATLPHGGQTHKAHTSPVRFVKRVQGDKMLLKAFTLAEVLVVIGIIGVVSALTIPNLQQGTNTQEVITKVTKARATIDEAYGRAIATYGDPCLWAQGKTSATDQAAVWRSRILENLKIDKDCGQASASNRACWYSDALLDNSYYTVKLSDGTSMAFSANTGSIATGYGCGSSYAFEMLIDIDGPNKGSGAPCDDVYALGYDASGYAYAGSKTGNLPLNNYSACAYWILDKGNADFLKATVANNSFQCKNNKYLDWSNNTTCN